MKSKHESIEAIKELKSSTMRLRKEIVRLRNRCAKAEDEIDEWKMASGLQDGSGDPGGITPNGFMKYWEEENARIKQKTDEMEHQIKRLRLQLARCHLEALGRIEEKDRIIRGDRDWSPAYGGVLDLRIKYNEALGAIERLETAKKEAYDEGHCEGFDEGYDQGRHEGR
jgi:flagellar biosynthesis/type III secretory pathway protein FliH